MEPVKYKLALNLLIFSGLRRGEIGGLKWSDIDFEDKIITVKRALKYVAGEGLFEGDPKTFKSRRSIKLPDFIFDLFKAYRVWQLEERIDRWQDHDFVFTRWNGEPMSLDTIGGYLKEINRQAWIKAGASAFTQAHKRLDTHCQRCGSQNGILTAGTF